MFSRLTTILALAAGLAAQVNKSNLTGIVRDASGGAAPGVAIKLTSVDTGVTRTESTDASGFYRFTLLDRGNYRLEAALAGFKQFRRDSVELQTGETTTIDITLEVGTQTESVTVTGEAALLRTETGALGTTVSQQVLTELPLIGRNPYVFLTLSPGIQYTGDPGALNPWDVAGPSAFAASGAEARSEFLLDGIPNMGTTNVSLSPSPDAVQEMRVQTSAYDAEFGHSGAAFVNVSTRAGTNEYHGTAYWYLRNDNLNANSFFNNRIGARKNEFKQNTYGASFGGPLWIPKLYQGKDKTHYFFNFEGTRIRGNAFARAVVPTELERNGNFSRTTDRQGRPYAIFDPSTTRQEGTTFQRTAFPNNIIPPSRFDPVAVNAMKFYPLPNATPASGDLRNFENGQVNGRLWASLASRVDHQINTNHSIFFRYGWNHRKDPSSPFYGECCRPAGNPTGGQDEFERGNIGAGASYTWVVSPRMVFDARMGFTRYFDANIMYGEGFNVSSLGFPTSFTASIPFLNFPRFTMVTGDIENLGAGRVPSSTYNNVYNPLFNFHYTLNRHALKWGYRYMVTQQNAFGPNRSAGNFNFARAFTQGPNANTVSALAGHDLASFLLGTPNSGSADINASPALQSSYHALYIHDDWKATPRLTLNAGLRFEHENGVTDRFNRGNAGIDFAVANPVEARAQANYARAPIPELAAWSAKGGLRFLATDPAPRHHLNMAKALWAPRLGYAFRLTNWMVARGGYGIFYVPNVVSNYRLDGFSLTTQMVTSLDNNLTPFNRLSNPFPSGLVQPPGAAGGLLTGVGQGVTAGAATPGNNLPDYKHGMNQQISQGFQWVLPGNFSIQAAYVGSFNQRLTLSRNINQYPDRFLALGATRLNARVANPFAGVITDATSALSQPTVTVQQLLRPFPQYTGVTQAGLPFGRSWSHSAQIEISKRMASGLLFGAAYTNSKLMEATSYLNPNDAKVEKVISDSDRPQRLVLHGLYDLPFGTGRKMLATANPVVRKLVERWQFNWIVTFQGGGALAFGGAERLTRSTNNPYTVDQWFDPSQFVPQQPFTLRYSSSRTSDLRAAGINKWDLTVQKSVIVREGVSFKVQAEFYNAFNRTHFGTPNTTVTSGQNFGRITGTFLNPREVQLSGRFTF